MTRPVPTLLLILDGWGQAPAGPGNAVSLARTPNLTRLMAEYPSTRLACSGRSVGLPTGFMGNSEVGHMNIGAGRVVYQDMTRIDMAIENGSFHENPVILQAMDKARAAGGRLHLMGLISDGGVHSHLNHVYALLETARRKGVQVLIHVFLDGRDTAPDSGKGFLATLLARMQELGVGRVATVMGRFYAMDRDKRYERNELAWKAMVLGQGIPAKDPLAAVAESYAAGEMDEFVKPRVLTEASGEPVGRLTDGDAVFFFNFRADRARQICRALTDPDFSGFGRPALPKLSCMATMTQYESAFPYPVAFAPESYGGTLGEVVSAAGLKQLRIAETEKYAHVTYFLNCGREEPFPGEDRELIPSPREVATYDLKPEMSAQAVTETLLGRWGGYDLVVCNLANLDMVGHTGIIPAAVKAVETVDACVGRLVDKVLATGGRVLLTADHGNAEEMIDRNGGPQTAHSMNEVALVYVERGAQGAKLRPGVLGDLAPTILSLWNMDRPAAMTGTPLVLKGGA